MQCVLRIRDIVVTKEYGKKVVSKGERWILVKKK